MNLNKQATTEDFANKMLELNDALSLIENERFSEKNGVTLNELDFLLDNIIDSVSE